MNPKYNQKSTHIDLILIKIKPIQTKNLQVPLHS